VNDHHRGPCSLFQGFWGELVLVKDEAQKDHSIDSPVFETQFLCLHPFFENILHILHRNEK